MSHIDATTERVKRVVAEFLSLDATNISEKQTFNELGADSLDEVELVMAIEEEFGCRIPDEQAERIHTVSAMVGYLITYVVRQTTTVK